MIQNVVILGCSNGKSLDTADEIAQLCAYLQQQGIQTTLRPTVFINEQTQNTHTAKQRATTLMNALLDPSVDAIFDVTGGDLANEVLAELDPKQLESLTHQPYYVAYSDNTVLLNALYSYVQPVNFLVTHLLHSEIARTNFEAFFLSGKKFPLSIKQPVYGGNLRCFLKLAGTEFFPTEKITALLIEGASGDLNKVRTYLAQLALMGIFDTLEVLIVGQFSEINQKGQHEQLADCLNAYAAKYQFAICTTNQVGHHHEVYPFDYKR
ncbi:MAG: LD-carboxypeptidase [Aerococcaceae bacterium]|nr:LD-carboxypeptidase [Aerococcaceae bacterium]